MSLKSKIHEQIIYATNLDGFVISVPHPEGKNGLFPNDDLFKPLADALLDTKAPSVIREAYVRSALRYFSEDQLLKVYEASIIHCENI